MNVLSVAKMYKTDDNMADKLLGKKFPCFFIPFISMSNIRDRLHFLHRCTFFEKVTHLCNSHVAT